MYKFPSNKLIIFMVIFLVVLSVMAYLKYPGTIGPFLLFNISYILVLVSCFTKPRLYSYTFFSLFMFFGFWLKFTVHIIIGYGFIEPTGQFESTQEGWDRVLVTSSIAAIGILFVKILLAYIKTKGSTNDTIKFSIPYWYEPYRKFILMFSIVAIIAVNSLNLWASFYQIGINPKIILPFHLNIIVAWLINIGFGIWVSVLVYWETCLNKKRVSTFVMFGFLEAVLSTITALSRSIYLFRALPYLFVILQTKFKYFVNKKQLVKIVSVFTACFLIGIVSVTLLRAPLFLSLTNEATQLNEQSETQHLELNGNLNEQSETQQLEPNGNLNEQSETQQLKPNGNGASKNQFTSEVELPPGLLQGAFKQVLQLTVDRWIGIEGVMAVSAFPSLSFDFFMEGLKEDPNIGVQSIYQQISKSEYIHSDKFTFLTLPGSTSILYYSGSNIVVFLGILFVTLLMVGTELITRRFLNNPFLISVTGLALANVFSQLNFPYLALVFTIQLWIALIFIWFVQEVLGKKRILNKIDNQRNAVENL